MRRLILAPTLVLSVSLAGCAGLDPKQSYRHDVRADYVAAVDHTARRRGVDVIWLNPPTQRRSRDIEWVTEVSVERPVDRPVERQQR